MCLLLMLDSQKSSCLQVNMEITNNQTGYFICFQIWMRYLSLFDNALINRKNELLGNALHKITL